MQEIEKVRVQCLVIAQAFETFWAYYLQSDGMVFEEQCRETARQFLRSFEELSVLDPSVGDPNRLALKSASDLNEILESVRVWADGRTRFPYTDRISNTWVVLVPIFSLKRLLIHDLQLDSWPPILLATTAADYSSEVLRWEPHLPTIGRFGNPSEVLSAASEVDTIAVVGDIRRSQDLMTYAISTSDFSERMVSFLENIRDLLRECQGFFDKFTGDGFIAYFNERFCTPRRPDPIDSFLDFTTRARQFSLEHFRDWCSNVRKLPNTPIGLAIGADIGRVRFHDLRRHLVAVGEPIVWASRMASAAKPNELLVNNLLWTALAGRGDVAGEERTDSTKAGEGFLARSISLPDSDRLR